jgi:hypothetical protein
VDSWGKKGLGKKRTGLSEGGAAGLLSAGVGLDFCFYSYCIIISLIYTTIVIEHVHRTC